MVLHQGLRPQGLSTLHSSTSEDPVAVLGIRRFAAPKLKISNRPLVGRHH